MSLTAKEKKLAKTSRCFLGNRWGTKELGL